MRAWLVGSWDVPTRLTEFWNRASALIISSRRKSSSVRTRTPGVIVVSFLVRPARALGRFIPPSLSHDPFRGGLGERFPIGGSAGLVEYQECHGRVIYHIVMLDTGKLEVLGNRGLALGP